MSTDNLKVTDIDNTPLSRQGAGFKDGVLTITVPGVEPVTVARGTLLAVDSATKKFVPYVQGGVANGNGIVKAVMTSDATLDVTGDVSVRPQITGDVTQNLLIIDADGDGSNIDVAELDGLRDFSIIPVYVRNLTQFDNPNNP